MRKGETKFFLQPGEIIDGDIQDVIVLQEDEALLLKAKEKVEYGKKTYGPGETWMIRGPLDFIPGIEVQVIDRRQAIPLDENEGLYVRDL